MHSQRCDRSSQACEPVLQQSFWRRERQRDIQPAISVAERASRVEVEKGEDGVCRKFCYFVMLKDLKDALCYRNIGSERKGGV